ncbi:hypothetical protein AAGW05_02880 [Arthrobacter sp. LAPM80]|uniref:hypothetical protein n=1 Tax=Arthrobacter sp. LAPM80 TaxID=3141788 RepID=UPI00398A62B9
MNDGGTRPGPTAYRLRVLGHLDASWSSWFDGMELTLENDGTTTLTGPVPDQAALHGLLGKVRDLGLTLICAQALPPGAWISAC